MKQKCYYCEMEAAYFGSRPDSDPCCHLHSEFSDLYHPEAVKEYLRHNPDPPFTLSKLISWTEEYYK